MSRKAQPFGRARLHCFYLALFNGWKLGSKAKSWRLLFILALVAAVAYAASVSWIEIQSKGNSEFCPLVDD
jgi:hypothetical protein